MNVSGRQLARPDFPDVVASALGDSGVDPERLCLEITETVLLDSSEAPSATLAALKDLGVKLALDDFGTGQSSLAYLRRLPLDILKLDRSFIEELDDLGRDIAIVSAVLDMARSLGITVVAEGVETEKQAACLRALDCELAQGFLFAHASPVLRNGAGLPRALARRAPRPQGRGRLSAPARTAAAGTRRPGPPGRAGRGRASCASPCARATARGPRASPAPAAPRPTASRWMPSATGFSPPASRASSGVSSSVEAQPAGQRLPLGHQPQARRERGLGSQPAGQLGRREPARLGQPGDRRLQVVHRLQLLHAVVQRVQGRQERGGLGADGLDLLAAERRSRPRLRPPPPHLGGIGFHQRQRPVQVHRRARRPGARRGPPGGSGKSSSRSARANPSDASARSARGTASGATSRSVSA